MKVRQTQNLIGGIVTFKPTTTYRNQNLNGMSIGFLICAVIVIVFWSWVELDYIAFYPQSEK